MAGQAGRCIGCIGWNSQQICRATAKFHKAMGKCENGMHGVRTVSVDGRGKGLQLKVEIELVTNFMLKYLSTSSMSMRGDQGEQGVYWPLWEQLLTIH